MNYREAIEFLNSTVNYERKPPDRSGREVFDLSRVAAFAERLGNPQHTFPALHIAGTNGKGSACAFADAILRAGRLKVGLYTSPHLVDVRERIRINGEEIPGEQFATILGSMKALIQEMSVLPEGQRRPTYFEILTHLAFCYFAQQGVDVAVLEVGMGGRLDATTICRPAVCGITRVSLDHAAILGETTELIAREKAGIVKPRIPVVVARQEAAAARVILEIAAEQGAPVEWEDRDYAVELEPVRRFAKEPRWGARMRVKGKADSIQAELGLLGSFQAQNWALAVRMVQIFCDQAPCPIPLNAFRSGSKKVRWPGRLEEIPQSPGRPRLFLDGAHNEDALARILEEMGGERGPQRPLVVLFGCAEDKAVLRMLKVVAQYADGVVFTEVENPRRCPIDQLMGMWATQSDKPAEAFKDPMAGLRCAQRRAQSTDAKGPGTVLALGSLYLVGALKERFLVEPPF